MAAQEGEIEFLRTVSTDQGARNFRAKFGEIVLENPQAGSFTDIAYTNGLINKLMHSDTEKLKKLAESVSQIINQETDFLYLNDLKPLQLAYSEKYREKIEILLSNIIEDAILNKPITIISKMPEAIINKLAKQYKLKVDQKIFNKLAILKKS